MTIPVRRPSPSIPLPPVHIDRTDFRTASNIAIDHHSDITALNLTVYMHLRPRTWHSRRPVPPFSADNHSLQLIRTSRVVKLRFHKGPRASCSILFFVFSAKSKSENKVWTKYKVVSASRIIKMHSTVVLKLNRKFKQGAALYSSTHNYNRIYLIRGGSTWIH